MYIYAPALEALHSQCTCVHVLAMGLFLGEISMVVSVFWMPGLWIHKWLGKFLANNSPVFPTAVIITVYHYRDHVLLGTALWL